MIFWRYFRKLFPHRFKHFPTLIQFSFCTVFVLKVFPPTLHLIYSLKEFWLLFINVLSCSVVCFILCLCSLYTLLTSYIYCMKLWNLSRKGVYNFVCYTFFQRNASYSFLTIKWRLYYATYSTARCKHFFFIFHNSIFFRSMASINSVPRCTCRQPER